MSCLVLSCLVLSCLVLSCLVLSCLVLSCLVLSCLVFVHRHRTARFMPTQQFLAIGSRTELLMCKHLHSVFALKKDSITRSLLSPQPASQPAKVLPPYPEHPSLFLQLRLTTAYISDKMDRLGVRSNVMSPTLSWECYSSENTLVNDLDHVSANLEILQGIQNKSCENEK